METPIAFPEEIANIYEKIMHYFDYKKSARIIDDIIKDNWHGSEQPSLLELGIGTGSLAIELQQLGYSVEGIDQSLAMLSRAMKKGLSSQSLHESDVTNFSLGKKFGVIISHAGPLRIDYTPERGYFFEMYATSSSSHDDVRVAVQKTSEHLEEEGLFLMSVQSAPGRDPTTASTPLRQTLENDYVATKTITEEGNMRVKRRELLKGGKLEGAITHRFLTLDIKEFNEIAEDYGLYAQGFNPTQHFYICSKR